MKIVAGAIVGDYDFACSKGDGRTGFHSETTGRATALEHAPAQVVFVV